MPANSLIHVADILSVLTLSYTFSQGDRGVTYHESKPTHGTANTASCCACVQNKDEEDAKHAGELIAIELTD